MSQPKIEFCSKTGPPGIITPSWIIWEYTFAPSIIDTGRDTYNSLSARIIFEYRAATVSSNVSVGVTISIQSSTRNVSSTFFSCPAVGLTFTEQME